jgi:hypothetical protein
MNMSYGKKIQANQKQITKNEQDLLALQRLILNSGSGTGINISLFQNKSFADYNEVIPFTTLLENMFEKVDSDAVIAIKSQEDEIFTQHFADYDINLKAKNKDLLFKALEDLYNSRFITKVMNLSMDYTPTADEKGNEFSSLTLSLRLYLK